MRDAPGADADPASPAPAADPTAIAARRAERIEEIVRALNPEQARAVTTTEGPLLILAGAGSGKTRVLAHRIAYLVGVNGVAPWRILAVTFTNRAAAELRERIISLVGEKGRDVQAGTFHALCARVLRQDGEAIGVDRRFVIYDTDDQQSLMKQILKEEDMPLTGEFRPSAVLGAISRAKNEMLDPTFLSENAANHRERTIARLATRYQARLRASKALDFDDLLLEAVRLFEEAPDVLAKYQEKWRYLHVDEYQDTNRAQYLWVRALATKHRNLCVVGDDDQSIYSWRGADLRNILDFERDWPEATVVKLEQNYRSTQLILDAAHAVVSRNSARKDKKLWTENQGGLRIQRFEAYNEDEEAEWIARQVESLVGGRGSALTRRADDDATDTRFRAREIAVMYRMNAQSRAIEESFLRYGIRYQLVGGTRFYARREVKDALAYLRILRSDTDSVSFERIINVPARGIGDKTIEVLRAAAAREDGTTWGAIEAAANGTLEGLAPRTRNALAEFATLVRRLRTRIGVLALPELLDEALEASGYRAMLADGSEEGEERWANLLELRLVTTRYDDLAPDDALDRLLEETALVADQDSYEGDADAVTLITLHAAKGLEFPVVFIAGLEEGLFPHSRALDDEKELEEERRLAYVGHHPRQAPAVPLARVAARHVGDGPGLGPVAVPARDPGRADGRAAARRRRRPRAGPRPRLRRPPNEPLQYADAWRRAWRVPRGQRPARRARTRRAVPPEPRPRREARCLRRRRAFRVAEPPRPCLGRRPRQRVRGGNAVRGPGRGAPRDPRRAPLPRRRPRAARALGRRHRGDVQAHAQRRGGHRRVQGPGRRPQADAREPREPRDRRVTDASLDLEAIATLDELEPLAQGVMDEAAFDYVAGGSWDEITLDENEVAWRQRRFRPRVLVDVSAVDPSTTMLGVPVAMPVAVAPMAVQGLAHPDGELAAVRGAAAAGVPYILSTTSSRSIEEVAAAAPDATRWFQLYVQADAARSRRLVERAAAAGYGAIVLTVDLPVLGYRDRDRRSGFELPPLGNFREVGATHGSHAERRARVAERDDPHLGRPRGDPALVRSAARAQGHPDRRGRPAGGRARGRTRSSSAITAAASSIGCQAGVDALAEVVAATGGRTEVWVDGGVRRGLDIAIALALGARGVLVGRPVYWALAIGGQAGVERAFAILRDEFEIALALLGARTPADVGPEHLVDPGTTPA